MFPNCNNLCLQSLLGTHNLCLELDLLFETTLLDHKTMDKENMFKRSEVVVTKFWFYEYALNHQKAMFCLPVHEYHRKQLQELTLAAHLILLIRSRKPYHIVSKEIE